VIAGLERLSRAEWQRDKKRDRQSLVTAMLQALDSTKRRSDDSTIRMMYRPYSGWDDVAAEHESSESGVGMR
jgi:hypothetical protein